MVSRDNTEVFVLICKSSGKYSAHTCMGRVDCLSAPRCLGGVSVYVSEGCALRSHLAPPV